VPKTFQRFIRNIDYPVCSQCMFFMQPALKKIAPYCSKFGEKNLFTGEIKYENISIARIQTNMCGEKGVYFVPMQDCNSSKV
jgi:hypothetical protein